jgi:2-polyprenyl-3-methyl-5-hydroxy-6-metoxy-1,4-benzoquinol methylase
LGLERGRYAAAFGVDVLHHVEDPTDVLRELTNALRARAPIVFLEVNPRFPIATMVALFQEEERNVLKIGFRTSATGSSRRGSSTSRSHTDRSTHRRALLRS